MSYYSREEQETIYRYDPVDEKWYVYSTYPPHIKRIQERAENCQIVEGESGNIIEIETVINADKIRLYK